MHFLEISGKVKPGRRQGRRLGFPTVNIPVPKRTPKKAWGIYFSLIHIDGHWQAGVTHLGPVKTFLIAHPSCETYILRFSGGDFTGQPVTVKLLLKFREVEHFPTIAHLKRQIRKDVALAKKFFGH